VSTLAAKAASQRAVLVRQSQLGDHEQPAPRPELSQPTPLRLAQPLLLPLSSAMRAITTDRVISLTYDDGPNAEQTVDVLDALAEQDAKATFFVLTDRAREHPEIVRRILDEGHQVGLHGLDHARLTDVGGREAVRRIRAGKPSWRGSPAGRSPSTGPPTARSDWPRCSARGCPGWTW